MKKYTVMIKDDVYLVKVGLHIKIVFQTKNVVQIDAKPTAHIVYGHNA